MTLSPVKAGRGDDAHPHFVHELVHLGVVAFVLALRNPVEPQGAGGRSAALVERGDEAGLGRHLRHHLVVGHGGDPRVDCRAVGRAGSCNGAHGTRAPLAQNARLSPLRLNRGRPGAVYHRMRFRLNRGGCLVLFARRWEARVLPNALCFPLRAQRLRRLRAQSRAPGGLFRCVAKGADLTSATIHGISFPASRLYYVG